MDCEVEKGEVDEEMLEDFDENRIITSTMQMDDVEIENNLRPKRRFR